MSQTRADRTSSAALLNRLTRNLLSSKSAVLPYAGPLVSSRYDAVSAPFSRHISWHINYERREPVSDQKVSFVFRQDPPVSLQVDNCDQGLDLDFRVYPVQGELPSFVQHHQQMSIMPWNKLE